MRTCRQGERDVEIRFDVVFHVLKCAELDIKVEDSKGMQYDPTHGEFCRGCDVQQLRRRRHCIATAVVAHKVPMNDGTEAVADLPSASGCRVHGVLIVKKVRPSALRVTTPCLVTRSLLLRSCALAPAGGGQLSHCRWRTPDDAHV